MEVSNTCQCPCRPGFTYKSFSQHKKTKMHLAWETAQDAKDIRVKSKQYENEVERLKNRLIHRENVEAELMRRIKTLEDAVEYWRKQSEGVYVY